VHDLVYDRRENLRSIAREVGISFVSVQAILTDVYGMSEVSARWLLRWLLQMTAALKVFRLCLFPKLKTKLRGRRFGSN
jgi:hypothetical protein